MITMISVFLFLAVIAGALAIYQYDRAQDERQIHRRIFDLAVDDAYETSTTADILIAGWRNGIVPDDIAEEAIHRAYIARQRATAAYFDAFPEDRTWKWT